MNEAWVIEGKKDRKKRRVGKKKGRRQTSKEGTRVVEGRMGRKHEPLKFTGLNWHPVSGP